jgi:hypothetical protein
VTTEQEHIYFNWLRIGWCSLKRRTPAMSVVIVMRDGRDGEYCVWTQGVGVPPAVEFFPDLAGVRGELARIGVYKEFPDFAV